MELTGNTMLITGGGTGIGRGLAHEFHKLGNTVIVAGRRREMLEETMAGYPGMIAMELDISDADAVANFAAHVIAEHPELNVLINNAGIMFFEDLIDLPAAEATIITNLLGPIRLTSALLPQLMSRPRAALVNVTSSLAFMPVAMAPSYGATKAALHSWSVAMREQLRKTSVEVIEVIPPAVQTELTPGQSQSPYSMPLDTYIAETMDLWKQVPTPEEIAGPNAEVMRCVVDQAKFKQVFEMFNRMG